MKLIIIITLVVWASCASVAHGSPTLNIYYVKAPDSIPAEYIPFMKAEIRQRFIEQFGVKIKVKIKHVSNSNVPYALTHVSKHFYYWHNKISKSHKGRHWALVLVPPMYKDGIKWMAGIAQDTCFSKYKSLTLAVSVAELKNSSGQDRFLHSIIAAMHELGHTLGLSHTAITPETIMHSGVLYYASPYMTFSEQHKKLGKECLRKL